MPVKLSNCRLGSLVVENPERVTKGKHPRIGHITGLTHNAVGEVMVVVRWAGDFTQMNFSGHVFESENGAGFIGEGRHITSIDHFTGDNHVDPVNAV